MSSTDLFTSSKQNLKLIIKAANQKFEDFIVENCKLDWTIKDLKQHLNSNYPKNPNSQSIRLIYSGKLLHDHFTLNDCIRHTSEIKSHIIHLVHSSNGIKASSGQEGYENDLDLDNELTPCSSSSSSDTLSASTSSSSTTSTSSLDTSSNPNISQTQNDLNNLYQPQQRHSTNETLSPKQQYEQTYSQLVNYYESVGFPVQSNPWYSAYLQQMALYNHMYSNYMSSIGVRANLGNLNLPTEMTFNEMHRASSSPAPEAQAAPEQGPAQQQQPVRNQANNNDQNVGEREDDWLGILHNIVSFLVLISIVYYYSSMERFLVIFAVVLVLILYHNGWLSLQRRRINPPVNNNQNMNANQDQDQGQAPNRNEPSTETPLANSNDQQQQVRQPNMLRLIITFVFTFFTSLIPERPRIVN